MSGISTLAMVNVDCDNPPVLAEFYHQVLGWEIAHSEDAYSMITSEGATAIGFGRVENYQRPQWPDPTGAKQFHLDMHVDDVEQAQQRCLELGASKPEFQPGGESWQVMLDPAGHPFCLCPRRS